MTGNETRRPRFILAADRWGSAITVIDLALALDPARDGTADAIVARVRCTPDIDSDGDGVADAPGSGQPVGILTDPITGQIIVLNHSGAVSPADTARFQHGHPGALAFIDLDRALASDDPLAGLVDFIPTRTAGPVGCALTPDGRHLLISSAEAPGLEDGGRHVTVFDLKARTVVRQVEQSLAPGAPANVRPSLHPGPHASFGAYPCPNGVAVSAIGPGYAFAANGGTDDISMFDIGKMLAGDAGAEIARISVPCGPFGLAVSDDGRWLAAANRESARTGQEGNQVSLIAVEEAASEGDACKTTPILVGTDDPREATRPFAVCFSPDGERLLATSFRTGVVSVVDMAAGPTGADKTVRHVALATPDNGPARPRGLAMLPGSDIAIIVGGAKGQAASGVIWLLDIETGRTLSRVAGVGDECYAVGLA